MTNSDGVNCPLLYASQEQAAPFKIKSQSVKLRKNKNMCRYADTHSPNLLILLPKHG